MSYSTVRFLFILLFSCVYGCTRFSVHPAEVKLVGAKITKLSLVQQDINLLVDITNTDTKSIFVRTIDYSVKVNGILLAKNEDFVWKTIPAKTTSQITIKMSANLWGQLLPLFQAAKSHQQINYQFLGKLITGNFLFRREVDINHSGVLTPEQLPIKYINKFQKYQKIFNSLKKSS